MYVPQVVSIPTCINSKTRIQSNKYHSIYDINHTRFIRILYLRALCFRSAFLLGSSSQYLRSSKILSMTGFNVSERYGIPTVWTKKVWKLEAINTLWRNWPQSYSRRWNGTTLQVKLMQIGNGAISVLSAQKPCTRICYSPFRILQKLKIYLFAWNNTKNNFPWKLEKINL